MLGRPWLQFEVKYIEGISNSSSYNKTVHGPAAAGKVTPPPFKNVIYTLGRGQTDFKNMILALPEKHEPKCFLQSIGSTISIFVTPLQCHDHLSHVNFTSEGWQKYQMVLPMLHEKLFFSRRSTRNIFLKCVTPQPILTVLQEWSRLAWTRTEMGVRMTHLTPHCTCRRQDDVSYIKLPQIRPLNHKEHARPQQRGSGIMDVPRLSYFSIAVGL